MKKVAEEFVSAGPRGALVCVFLLVASSACAAAPNAVPAAGAPEHRRLALVVDSDDPASTEVHVTPAIARACHMPVLHFALASAALRKDRSLDRLAACFTKGPMEGRRIRLVGHADPRGETEYNFDLGQRRAGNVKSYLLGHGMAPASIITSSRGELDAVGTDEAGWAEDRRVDILFAEDP